MTTPNRPESIVESVRGAPIWAKILVPTLLVIIVASVASSGDGHKADGDGGEATTDQPVHGAKANEADQAPPGSEVPQNTPVVGSEGNSPNSKLSANQDVRDALGDEIGSDFAVERPPTTPMQSPAPLSRRSTRTEAGKDRPAWRFAVA